MRPRRWWTLSLLVACQRPVKEPPETANDTDTAVVDADSDGWPADWDCNDEDPLAHPAAVEVPYDGSDNDCDPSTPDDDLDGDGYTSVVTGGADCDDADPLVNPEADEVMYDGADNDCDPGTLDDDDRDDDGWTFDEDCDDDDPDTRPDAVEICDDGVDNDCDREVDLEDAYCADLESLASLKVTGESPGDLAGVAVAGTGDVNGDGLDDLLIGAFEEDSGGEDSGAAYLVLGGTSGDQSLSTAQARFKGEMENDQAGFSVAGAGDVDGDGYKDLLVGAWQQSSIKPLAGAAYLILGPTSGTQSLADSDAILRGENIVACAGNSVAGADDVDGDGHSDLLIGSYGEWSHGDYAGAAYLMLGPVTGDLDLRDAHAKLLGEEEGDYAGYTVARAGDLDGDGLSDLLVTAENHDGVARGAGAVYLLRGPVAGRVDLADADAKLLGEGGTDDPGTGLASAGDVDGDGLLDLVVGAPRNNEGGLDAGAAYLVLGPVTGTMVLSDARSKLVGEERDDWAGYALAGAGDLDLDGHDDLLVGAPFESSRAWHEGATYIVMGPVTGTVDLALADMRIAGRLEGVGLGISVSSAGDVDGDGDVELLLGAWGDDSGGNAAGAAFVLDWRGL